MNQSVVECIYAAVDEVNLERGDGTAMEKELGTPIQGKDGSNLDSLNMINFVAAVEENVENAFGVEIMIGDERALDLQPSPFETIGSLAEYIEKLIEQHN